MFSHLPHIMPRLLTPPLLLLVLSACSSNRNALNAYEASPVSRADIVQHVTASGTLAALVSVDVGSQVSGKITKLHVDFNSVVRRGQLVAEIDPTLYLATLRQAQGELAGARATVILKRQNLERKRILVPQRAASQLDLDQATAELAQAEASVMIREATVQSARANVEFCKITAPVDGLVISRKIDVGQTVIAAMNSPVLFTIAKDLRKMNINTSVSESDIGQLSLEQTVNFTVDAFPDEVFRGRVSQIRKAPTMTQNVVTYECIIAVDNPAQKLFPGMTADVSIMVADHKQVLTVPNAALRYSPPTDAVYESAKPRQIERTQRLVYVAGADGQSLRAMVIRTGITDGTRTEVVAGLTDGSAVVTSTRPAAQGKGVSFTPPQPPPAQ
jgi:HlyD family secretion protein